MSLKARFILTFGFGTVLFMLLITFLVFNRMESVMEKQLFKQFYSDGQNSLALFNEEIRDLDVHFRSSTTLPMFNSMRFHELTLNHAGLKNDIRQLELYFYELMQKDEEILKIVFVDTKATEVFRIEKGGISSDLHDLSLNKEITELLDLQKDTIRTTVETDGDQILSINWWMPVYVSTSTKLGIMSFSLDFKLFQDKIKSLVTSKAESACLSDDKGLLLSSSENTQKCLDTDERIWRVETIVNLKGPVWKLSLLVDSDSFLEEVSDLKSFVFLIIFPIVAGIAFLFTFLFSSHISNAVEKLVIAAKSIGKGEVLSVVPLNRDDELGELAIEMKRSAELIQEHRSSLEDKNRDLEAYSYTLAHDLRTPLRSISSFAQILEQEAKEKLNEEENDFIQRIVKASKRMSALIDDILELSRISNCDISVNRVSLSDLAEVVIEQFKQTDEKRKISVIIEEGLDVDGDVQLLRLVFENLLGNAWKYTGKNEHSQIEFGSKQADGSSVYYIRDNGVGFDMRYVNKLFSPFQRLHTNEEFEGTGIGLASVKRMIERHMGTIWIESTEDVVTTVYFTLWDDSNNKGESDE